MSDFYDKQISAAGSFAGTCLIQASGEIGGHKHVFVSLSGPKLGVMYPTFGGYLANPFKGQAKMYAADLIQYETDTKKCLLLKTYEVAKATTLETDTVIYIASGKCKNGEVFRHIPFVGDNLMVAPDTAETKGKGVTVTAVEKTYATDGKQDGWKVTLSKTLGTLAKGAVLVEAASAGDSVLPMVTKPNCYIDHDYDILFDAAANITTEYDKARYFFTPIMMEGREYAYIDKMQPMPKYVEAINESKFKGWFKL